MTRRHRTRMVHLDECQPGECAVCGEPCGMMHLDADLEALVCAECVPELLNAARALWVAWLDAPPPSLIKTNP